MDFSLVLIRLSWDLMFATTALKLFCDSWGAAGATDHATGRYHGPNSPYQVRCVCESRACAAAGRTDPSIIRNGITGHIDGKSTLADRMLQSPVSSTNARCGST
jgi:hypothetical protein